MDNCIVRINESLDSFSKQEKKVARYILDHQQEVTQMTITELARKCKSSTATIVRFCTIIGFKGYRDFIKSFYHDVANSVTSDESIYELDNKNPNDLTIKQTIEVVSRLNIESISNTLKIINEDCIEKAVSAIDKSCRVCIYALSGSIVVAEDAVFKFERLGIDCKLYDTPHSQILSTSILKPECVALFISYTGETKEIIEAAEIATSRGVTTISISKYGETPLKKVCTINIQHSSIGKGLRTMSTRSRIVQQNIIDILYVALAQRRGEYLKRYYEIFDYNPKTEMINGNK